jgi:hypothetical protein
MKKVLLIFFFIFALAGTPVVIAGGAIKNIEDVHIGDTVRSYDERINKFEDKRVIDTIESETNELIHITLNNSEIVTATPTHNFFANNEWLEAKDLRAGDILLTVNGEHVIVEQVQHELLEQPIKTYNFTVDGNHTYSVGETGVVAHNACGKEFNYSDKVIKQMDGDIYHGFPNMIDDMAQRYGMVGKITGKDGIERTVIELPGFLNGTNGVYQYIIEPNGMVNHRLFQTVVKKFFLIEEVL